MTTTNFLTANPSDYTVTFRCARCGETLKQTLMGYAFYGGQYHYDPHPTCCRQRMFPIAIDRFVGVA